MAKRRRENIHRMPNLLAWADRLAPQTRVIVFDLAGVPQIDENSAMELRAVLQRLRRDGREMVIAGLNAEQYRVMRQAGTERAHSSAMCTLFGPGVYACGCCDTDLFDASSKFDSKSGWPSFTQTLAPGLVAYHADRSHGMTRVETTCNVCDAHLGHVFPDGPKPSGLRFCMNGASLRKR